MLLTSLIAGSAFNQYASGRVAKDKHTGRLPAMGFSSWNEYGCSINESVFLTVGERLISTGLKDLGYEYVNIDDCWSDKAVQRDKVTKEIRPDYTKFPRGIKHTADRIHALGLKLGIYSDAGSLTCAGYAGSLGHEDIDAKTFANWGIDYLKYDNCNVPAKWLDEYEWWPERWTGGSLDDGQPSPPNYDWATSNTARRFVRMRDELEKQHRVIQYSLCAWGHGHVDIWGNTTGQSWRMWGDIAPQWTGQDGSAWGLMPIVNHASFFANVSDFWGHGDYDMLEVGNGNLTLEENRSHFALWAALKSPLIIGTPLDNIPPSTLSILSTPALIAYNQDPTYGRSATPYKWGLNPDNTWNRTHPAEYWAGPSSLGIHVFILNTLDYEVVKVAVWAEVPGLRAGRRYRVTDMWSGEDWGVWEGAWMGVVRAHDTIAVTITEVDGRHPSPE
ncbi:glycoside hydrolase [Pseudovirgaria hyperparasitica]|uniref:Alpha-galactosidase n=1 Tax=Pseudovirgaria hyperparasitica TaxID=470096 RepID=A0A6A6VS73_9PEZI|nr:glycoside hydrolase [Pseudovirgaria hyperparasitica]KAF2753518.1 glycoside hydrolase [Pseudovirgaria hyperparasitica]